MKNDMLKKVIIGTTIGLIMIMSCLFKFQSNKIKTLEHDLTIKQEVAEQQFDYTETEVVKEIEKTLHTESDLIIQDGKVNIKHKYVLDDTTILGIHQTETLVATADCYYEYILPLQNAEITVSNRTINIIIPEVKLNQDATHRISNTMHVIEDETDSSFFSTKAKAQKAARYWEDTFDKRANERIASMYDVTTMRDESVKQVTELVEHLIPESCSVNIKVK